MPGEPCRALTATVPGSVKLMDPDLPRHLSVLDPRSGQVIRQTLLDPLPEVLANPLGDPRVYVFTNQPVAWDANLSG